MKSKLSLRSRKIVRSLLKEDVVDAVTIDIPLFVRLLEYAKEDAKTDMDLHFVAEKAIALGKTKSPLSMSDYASLLPDGAQPGEV